MTREEHIEQAEELLAGEFNESLQICGTGWYSEPKPAAVERAKVHALLAVAKAPRRSWWSRVMSR
jgi:hypothetical protein